ncbi:Hypothetical_protein [Hexamita inflata]|uniref:Hypothetical_protein n=1 Tax=Hexamita inflata TaxID=28002 RepID=A0AA86TYN2_9EUKA|nr:Hypothetical protein HINF_LOCUS21001 [Hexamita inflata]
MSAQLLDKISYNAKIVGNKAQFNAPTSDVKSVNDLRPKSGQRLIQFDRQSSRNIKTGHRRVVKTIQEAFRERAGYIGLPVQPIRPLRAGQSNHSKMQRELWSHLPNFEQNRSERKWSGPDLQIFEETEKRRFLLSKNQMELHEVLNRQEWSGNQKVLANCGPRGSGARDRDAVVSVEQFWIQIDNLDLNYLCQNVIQYEIKMICIQQLHCCYQDTCTFGISLLFCTFLKYICSLSQLHNSRIITKTQKNKVININLTNQYLI